MRRCTFFTKRCPLCHTTLERRIRRSYWMRFLPLSRHFECDYCRTRVLTLMEVMSWRVSWPKFD